MSRSALTERAKSSTKWAMALKARSTNSKFQMELSITRPREPDRNHLLGGRSFYFFDFDDNVAFLSTRIFLFHKKTGQEFSVSTADFARYGKKVGVAGPFKDYEVRYDDATGSFRRFRDISDVDIARALRQPFVEDVLDALSGEDLRWKGPSWGSFFHAAYNQRPLSVITARGHHPETIKNGINAIIESGHLPVIPNYLAIFPVSHPETRFFLGDEKQSLSVARLKQLAIRQSVELAFKTYGFNPHHRFGMSDDDPHNIELILEEMRALKTDYPEVSFFLIETHGDSHVKYEVLKGGVERHSLERSLEQLQLF